MNDPDVLLWITPDTWYGWPDFSADLMPISDPRFQPTPLDLIARTGYPDLSFLIDHESSGLVGNRPDTRTRLALIQGVREFRACLPGRRAVHLDGYDD